MKELFKGRDGRVQEAAHCSLSLSLFLPPRPFPLFLFTSRLPPDKVPPSVAFHLLPAARRTLITICFPLRAIMPRFSFFPPRLSVSFFFFLFSIAELLNQRYVHVLGPLTGTECGMPWDFHVGGSRQMLSDVI